MRRNNEVRYQCDEYKLNHLARCNGVQSIVYVQHERVELLPLGESDAKMIPSPPTMMSCMRRNGCSLKTANRY